ncbi:MAG: cytosolic protein [Deltaproteobacteria bacterium]|nr:MAG: cytosolic protein [Deltaproteobacteria bacterium]
MAGIWDTKSKVPEKRARELLKGAVDFHIHTGPDIYPRLINDIEAARQAKKAGMKAVLIKSHATITADRAQIARFVTGFPVFGGVALNWHVGGLNKYAVECAARMGAKQVWMPTTHTANYLKYVDHVPMFARAMPKDVQGIRILKGDGSLVAEIASILEAVAKNDMILATGHLAPDEGITLIREAKKAGVEKIVVTHPAASFVNYSVDQMREALNAGATYLEHVFNDCTPQVAAPLPPSALGDPIKAIGPEYCIMSTDSGQVVNPPPVKVMTRYIQEMLDYGFSERAIRTMTAKNPARILGL